MIRTKPKMAPKRRSISVEEKLKLLSEMDRYPTVQKSHWARKFNLPSSTLFTILNNRKAIEESARKMQGRLSSRKKWKTSPFEDVEIVLLEWIKQCSAENIPLNGFSIKEKALLVARKFNVTNFNASNGWLERFKHRYGVLYSSMKKFSPYSDPSMTASEWMDEKLQDLIKDYDPKDIYSADETGLFYNLLVDTSCSGVEDSDDRDDRLTVLLCTNSDGSNKLPPLVIGKTSPPCGFKNFQTLLCKYVVNKNAWLTCSVFEEYLIYLDNEMDNAGRKILIFIDHCAAHPPNTFLKNVKVLFYPSSCSEEVQPLRNGVIHSFKQIYCKTFDHNVELIRERHGPASMKVELIEALQFVVLSWEEVNPAVIRNCFFRVGFKMLTFDKSVDSVKNNSLKSTKTIDPKNKLPTCGVLTIDEICEQIISKKKDTDNGETLTGDTNVSFGDSNDKIGSLQDEVCENGASGSEVFSLEISQKSGYNVENSRSESVVKLMNIGNNEIDKNPPDFEEALSGFKKYKKYVCSFNIDEGIQNILVLMEIALYKLHSREMLCCPIGSEEDQAS